MKKVLVYGAYDLDNLGDDYMMYQIDTKLKKSDIIPVYLKVKNRINYFKMNNYETIDIFKGKNKLEKFFNILKEFFSSNNIKDIDALIFMGGGYTNENFGMANLIKMLLITLIFKSRKKKVIFTGQTVGPYKTNLFKLILKKIYKSASKVFVREEYSNILLDSLNIKNELSGDDAYLTLENLENDKNFDEKENCIIYNYKDFKGYENYKDDYFNMLLNIAIESKFKIKIIPFRSEENSNEYKINYELYTYLKNNNIDVEFIVERDINEFQKIFKKSKYVVGTAYHSIVLGLIFNCLPYSAYCGDYYKMKINGILKWYNYDDKNCIDISNINNNNFLVIENEFKDNLNRQTKITKKISNNVSNAWNEIIKDI